jgi:hypothetical protein
MAPSSHAGWTTQIWSFCMLDHADLVVLHVGKPPALTVQDRRTLALFPPPRLPTQ